MKLPHALAPLLLLTATAVVAGDYCKELRKSKRDPAGEPRAVAVQGPDTATRADDGGGSSAAPIEQTGPFYDASAASRPGPQAGAADGGPRTAPGGLAAHARGGTMSTPKQRADREIRGVIRRLHGSRPDGAQRSDRSS